MQYKDKNNNKTAMFALYPLCPCLLSGGVLFGNLEAAEEVQLLGLCGVHAVQNYDILL